jgi:methylated-DNA-protein-cysteine methyltransferase-like protein
MMYRTKNSAESKKHLWVRTMILFYERVYTLVRQIPPGNVVTYGQVAALLGSPRAARAVGYALRFLPAGTDVPWHRVINHRGQISLRTPIESPLLQRLLLEEEGVVFDAEGRVDLALYRWQHAVSSGTESRRRV